MAKGVHVDGQDWKARGEIDWEVCVRFEFDSNQTAEESFDEKIEGDLMMVEVGSLI